MIPRKVLWQCLRRSWCVGAAMSTHHMQRAGFLYALDPALVVLYPDSEDLKQARQRYLQNVRTHTVMASLLVGLFIALEVQVARKAIPATALQNILHTTATTLSAIGDSFFSGTFLVMWALGCFLCFLLALPAGGLANLSTINHVALWPMLAWTGFLLALVTSFCVYMFYAGVHKGLGALRRLGTFNLINWAERIKVCNALCIALLLGLMVDGKMVSLMSSEIWCLVCMLGAILLIKKAHTPRVALVAIFFLAMFLQGTMSSIY